MYIHTCIYIYIYIYVYICTYIYKHMCVCIQPLNLNVQDEIVFQHISYVYIYNHKKNHYVEDKL